MIIVIKMCCIIVCYRYSYKWFYRKQHKSIPKKADILCSRHNVTAIKNLILKILGAKKSSFNQCPFCISIGYLIFSLSKSNMISFFLKQQCIGWEKKPYMVKIFWFSCLNSHTYVYRRRLQGMYSLCEY